jgi:two-component sensor histidine kinase
MFKLPIPAAVPYALSRIDELLAKIFAASAAVLSIDVFRNGIDQLQYIHSIWFWGYSAALLVSLLGALVSAFWFGRMKIWYRTIVFCTLAAMVTWPLQVADTAALPMHFKPYIWWAVGFAALAAAGAFKNKTAIAFLILMPTIWFFILTSQYGGSENVYRALEDALYSFFFSGSISVLVMFLRHRANQVDSEYAVLYQTRLERAFLDVLELERTKVNSIVHDNVIAALDAAAEASSEDQRLQAAHQAKAAIGRLERESDRDPMARNQISSQAYFESLKASIERQSKFVLVKVKSRVDVTIPFEIAVGLAEATFQAVVNSLEHAPKANLREVVMSSTRDSIKVLVIDDGPGFRMSAVPRNRLGIRVAIFERLKSLGVTAKLKSAPGEGTTWVFEWVLS